MAHALNSDIIEERPYIIHLHNGWCRQVYTEGYSYISIRTQYPNFVCIKMGISNSTDNLCLCIYNIRRA